MTERHYTGNLKFILEKLIEKAFKDGVLRGQYIDFPTGQARERLWKVWKAENLKSKIDIY